MEKNQEVDLSWLHEYLTNIIYNKPLPPDCEYLVDVPLQVDVNPGWLDKYRTLGDKVFGVHPDSLMCCLIQLLHLFTFQRFNPSINLSTRNIRWMKLLLQKKKPAASINEIVHYNQFQKGYFKSGKIESIPRKVLKVLVEQDRDGIGFVYQNIRPSNCAPAAVYMRFVQIMKVLVNMLPDRKVTGISSHKVFEQFFDRVEDNTAGFNGLQQLKEHVEANTILMRNYSLYTSMKEISFWSKVAAVDTETRHEFWREVYENEIEDIIKCRITKVAYSGQKNLASLRKTIKRQSQPHFVFYFKMHPTDEDRCTLTYIELEHSDVPVESTMEQFLYFLSQDKETGIATRCSPQNEGRQSLTFDQSLSETRLYSSKYLGNRNGQLLNERDLLRILSQLCMRGIILRIRLNAVLCNQFTHDEHRSETIHYFNMIDRKIVTQNFERQHIYVRHLQAYP